MALSKERKEELVAGYNQLIQKSQGMILTEFSGIHTEALGKLRSQVREAQGEIHVTKNTLVEYAFRQAGLPVPGGELTKSTAVGFAFEDVSALAKTLVTFAKESQFVKIKGGLVGKRLLTVKEVETLAELPPLPVVRAQLLGVVNAPARNLAGVVAGSVRQVVNVLKAFADKDAEERRPRSSPDMPRPVPGQAVFAASAEAAA